MPIIYLIFLYFYAGLFFPIVFIYLIFMEKKYYMIPGVRTWGPIGPPVLSCGKSSGCD